MACHVCPWWVGYLLINPFRRIKQNPEKILDEYVKPGMTVLEIGPGMGFFSLWMADRVTDTGKIVCVDIQQRMIRTLMRRAAKRGLAERIDGRVCPNDSLGIDDLDNQVDFALLFAVVHEVPDPLSLFHQIHRSLKPGGTCLLAEPSGHVKPAAWKETQSLAIEAGFRLSSLPQIARSRSVLIKPAE